MIVDKNASRVKGKKGALGTKRVKVTLKFFFFKSKETQENKIYYTRRSYRATRNTPGWSGGRRQEPGESIRPEPLLGFL